MFKINPSIFREYDIRGRESNDELNPKSLELIGRAYGTYLAKNKIKVAVVGRDGRQTSQKFQEAAVVGLLSAGISIIDIGIVMTPMMYWAQFYFKTKGGMMITASHNPRGWNGAKLASGFSSTLGGAELKGIYKIIEKNEFIKEGGAKLESKNIKEEYIKDLILRINISKKFNIVVNTGNGTAGLFAPDLLRAAGCNVIEHNTKLDSSYPNYTPNPAELEMMEDTATVVVKNKADFGLAFDGDGDRLGVVDEKGNIIWPDYYMIFLSRLILKNKPAAKIVFDVKSSKALEENIERMGGIPIMAPTGHSNIKRVMKEESAELGGELSGHMFFKQNYYGFDDASFAALSLVEYFSKQEKSVSELLATVSHYVSTPGYNAATPDDKKFKIVKNLKQEFKKEGYEVIDIDGARVSFKNGWGLVRVSNTSPNITLRFEADTEKDLEKIKKIFKEKLSQYECVSKEWIAG